MVEEKSSNRSGSGTFMMPSLSWVGRTVFSLLLLWRSASSQNMDVPCSVAGPVGALHPVQGLLERFEAGPGCAARERGNKETHVIAVGTATNSPENKVTVLLKPLSLSTPLRPLHLLLSSKLPVSWWLEADRLPPNLPVLVQLSLNSSIQSSSLHLHVQKVRLLPCRPRALHRWALEHHGNLSSLTHTTHGNRVYVSLGEDPTMPDECHLQSLFLSHNYMTSDLQQQDVQGCANAAAGGISPEVHVIKLHSAGPGLCGSLQVEVIVSLVPLVTNSNSQKVVLILSSSVPVSWAIIARGVRGHIFVHSSNSVSPPYPPEPRLTLSNTLNPDLSTISDILVWARENGYNRVTSYTEADLANRFVIKLAGGGTGVAAVMNPQDVSPHWVEEHRLRQWLNGGGRAGGGPGGLAVQCDDGRLGVTLDQHILKSLSVSVAAVTLRDSTCQAQSNGSHFLLVFPVSSCGTEVLLLGHPRRMQYKNTVLFWRGSPPTILALNETEKKLKSPLGIHFSCLTAIQGLPGPANGGDINVNTPQTRLVPWAPEGPVPDSELSHLPTPRHRSGPFLILRLFVTENYEQGRIGPCVISADQRLYVEISAKGPSIDVVEVNSCVVSPLSDPKRSRFWTVISDGCSSDPSLMLMKKDEEEEAEGELEEEKEGTKRLDRDVEIREGDAQATMSSTSTGAEEKMQPLRFSFILRPVFNESMQFLHCSLQLCASDPTKGEPVRRTVRNDCQGGTRIPPLVSNSPKHQCEIRNLSRPMVVTQPLAPKLLRPTAGQRPKRLSVCPVTRSDPEHSSSVVHTGPVMGVVFAAFVMGVALMGGLWCICSNTAHSASLGEARLTNQTHGVGNISNPPSLSDQSTSCV